MLMSCAYYALKVAHYSQLCSLKMFHLLLNRNIMDNDIIIDDCWHVQKNSATVKTLSAAADN